MRGRLRIDSQIDHSVLGSLRVVTVLDLDPIARPNYLNERPCIVGKTLAWQAQAM